MCNNQIVTFMNTMFEKTAYYINYIIYIECPATRINEKQKDIY